MGSSSVIDDSILRKSDEVQTTVTPVVISRDAKTDEAPKTSYVTTNLRRAHTVAQGRNMGGETNLGSRSSRERMALSLLRAKDSHELMRKRPANQFDIPQTPRGTLVGSRGMSHFTVGNVGQNGKIFLRPIQNPSLKEPPHTPSSPPTNKPKKDSLHPHRGGYGLDEPSRWSNSQLSELRPDILEENYEDEILESAQPEFHHRPTHHPLQRAHSFSTISDQRSASRAEGTEGFRVVIERPDDRPKSADGFLIQPVQTRAPHYQLDTLQSNPAEGLHRNLYPRDPWHANVHLHSSQRPSFAASMFSGVSAMELSRSAAVSPDPVLYDLKDPIKPSIFEALITVMDDESVVRYIPGTRNISAATPARIVAQISSESFMDYELVSDFFLTFRPYLSAGSLLSLLLARLQWAINRLQEDGRIIRIRTFAALRHWILNYFVDDFVPELKLRIHFCETINRLYDSVKAREGGGLSDLKILIDLKRCWHGKCATSWDTQDHHVLYQSPDHPIVPGGDEMVGSEDQQNLLAVQRVQDIAEAVPQQPQLVRHDRNDSSTTAKSLPVSAESDFSIHAISCSLPPKSPKRLSMPFSHTKAPYLVSLVPSKQNQDPSSPLSPISSRRYPFYGHAHKRSGSFSDSVRDDRAPLSLINLDHKSSFSSQEPLDLCALIRGELYPPVESFMTIMAPPSPPLPSSTSAAYMYHRNATVESSSPKPSTSGSGVKTIIGSIRRALNGKHSGQPPSRAAHGSLARGKTSTLPTNVAFGSELYRDRKSATPLKKPARIDILCDEALSHYRQHVGGLVDWVDNDKAQHPAILDPDKAKTAYLAPNDDRIQSQLTGGSQSIVIVDGTGMGRPTMSGAVPSLSPSGLEQPPYFLTAESSPTTPRPPSFPSSRGSTLGADEYSLPIYYDETSRRPSRRASMFLRPSGISAARRSLSVERASSSWRRPSPSLGLRKYASFQSGISKQRLALGNEENAASESQAVDNMGQPTMPTLRRRPGGDLRQMRDDRSFQSRPGSGSILSEISYRGSIAEGTLEDPNSRPQTSLVPPNPRFSLIKTHSSQNLRRSFEAAIARFAEIPDDSDGGIESTLLKLEGKWQGTSTSNQDSPGMGLRRARETHIQHGAREEISPHDNRLSPNVATRKPQSFSNNLTYSQARTRTLASRPYSESIVDSEDSYSSIPLLERGLSDESMKKPMTPAQDATAAQFLHTNAHHRDQSDVESSHPSIDMVRKTESLKRIPKGSTLPVPYLAESSLRVKVPRLSGLSSELSVDLIDPKEAMEQLSFDTQSLSESSLGIPPRPPAQPPSPPMTIQNPRSIASVKTSLNPVFARTQPLTPDPSPIHNVVKRGNIPSIEMRNVSGDVLSRSEADHHAPRAHKSNDSYHVPFVLSCESQLLAQQFTLVEMAALGEVDWRDLVDMKWNSGPPFTTSWVQFLVEEERRGIDLVVGRFNLMVKWVLSEIVLTYDMHERARTISKFIHTAAHARRMCNYATMLQIAIALSSTDCSRLQATWALVSAEDKRLLKDMELLIQPVRNFHDLRVEMETANVQEGCIPFVGLYVHDLTYNAQKPAQVSTTRDGEPLVNFERYRTTARIVKNLLRLIDASTKYKFEPVQGIIERVLWIASLSEEQIQTRSRQLD